MELRLRDLKEFERNINGEILCFTLGLALFRSVVESLLDDELSDKDNRLANFGVVVVVVFLLRESDDELELEPILIFT